MFYTAQALLLTRDTRRSKYSAVIAAFNEQFVKSGGISPAFFKRLRDGFEDRAEGDYALAAISEEQARASIAAAREFVKVNRHTSCKNPNKAAVIRRLIDGARIMDSGQAVNG